MRRFDLLRSPLLLLSVGLLLLNDFVLKAAFHNWLTGKLSDVAGLAAFTIFCCALWPRHVWRAGGGITAFFMFWKSPCASGAIEVANAILPFSIGRTVDYTDLIALPVVSLVCANTHRLPLVDLGKIGVWLTAGVCPLAFTATSSIDPHYSLSSTAKFPKVQSGTEAALAEMLDEVASRHGLRCERCPPLSKGRLYRAHGPLQIVAGFDAGHNRLLVEVSAFGAPQAEIDKTRPEVDQLKAEIEQALKQRFPSVSLGERRAQIRRTIVVRVVLPPIEDQFRQAFAIVADTLRRAGFKIDKLATRDVVYGESLERIRVTALLELPALGTRTTRCRDDGTVAVSIYSQTSDYDATRQRIVDELQRELASAFGPQKVSVDDDPYLCR